MAAVAILFVPDLRNDYGFHPDQPTFQTVFTSLFLHANIIHLLGNMIFLAAVGAAVEMAAGSWRFACVYFISGIIGVMFQFLVTRHTANPAPVMGASGCIAGCAGYYSVRYTGLRVAIAPNLSMNVATITIIWMALQLIGGFIRIGDSGGVAFWSHVGGFLGGILISLVFRAPDLGQVRLGHEVLDRMNNRGPMAAATAAKQHLEKHPGDPKALRQLARAYSQMGEPEEEAKAIMGLLEVEPLTEHPNLLARLLEIGQAKIISSHKRTALAEKFKDMNPAVARALLTSVLQEPPGDSQRPEALLALVGLERERSPKSAQALLDELLRTYPLHPCTDLARKRGWVN